jgi:dephospho-CoA kinase
MICFARSFKFHRFHHRIPVAMSSKSSMSMSSQTDEKNSQFKVLGVCGGIGSGKSSACKLLVSSLGCLAHLDADSVAHSVYSPGSQAVRDIAAEFGSIVLQENGEEIDRKKLGAIVFADRSEMAVSRAVSHAGIGLD